MIKAIFFDIDGTLLDGSKGIPESSLIALNKLREKGIKTIISTGRGLKEIEPLNLKGFDAYLLLNGQICYSSNGEIIFDNPVNKETHDKFVKVFNDKKIAFGLCTANDSYLNFTDERIKALYAKLDCPLSDAREYNGEKIYQAMGFGGEDIKQYLREYFPECIVTSWNGDGSDIISKDSGKDKGIKKYIELMNIKLDETMAFGDGDNDITMLKYAGIGVAMGNANDNVKEAADYITSRIDEDGIYNALIHFGVIDND